MAEATAQSETAAPLPDSASLEQAVALMDGLGDDEHGEANASAEGRDGAEVSPVSSSASLRAGEGEEVPEGEEGAEGEVEEQPEEQVVDTDAPEFWSAEDKAAWNAVPAELRPVLKKYEQQRVEFVNEKAREAAQVRAQAQAAARQATDVVDQAAKWWAQAGPAFHQAFADKWAQVNWSELAEKNPGEWARLNQIRMDEGALLAEANRRGQADMQAAQARAEQAFHTVKRAEHAKLATRMPEYFAANKAQQTYDELGKFLSSKGIPADRINQIHEAPIIEIALAAMRYEQAQKKASTVTGKQPGAANTTARATPTRVQPGPAARTGNRAGEAARQVGERFRRGGGQSIEDAAELIRLNGL